jgi:LysM repeat protein
LYKARSMSKTLTLPVLLLIVALLVPATLSGQVSYEVSDQKVVLDGKTYYMHLVLKDQTLYSIAKTYKVPIDAITSINVIPANGIQTDQVLRIPESAALAATKPSPRPPAAAVKEPQPVVQPEKQTPPPAAATPVREDKPAGTAAKAEAEGYRMHKVKKGETLYSLSRDYKVTVEAIIRVNDVPRNEIQTGQILKIPPSDYVTFVKEDTGTGQTPQEEVNTPPAEAKPQPEATAIKPQTEVPAAKAEAKPQTEAQTAKRETEKQPVKPEPKTYHKVKKGESLSDIAAKYNVTVREIKDANEGLIFPMTGMKLVIPVKKSEGTGTEIKE